MRTYILTIVLLALSGLTAHAQSCDARYPMGIWQTHIGEDEAVPKLFVNMVFYRVSGCCGNITITDYETDEEEFSGDLYYAGKEIKDGVPTGTYYFDVKVENKMVSRISVNASQEPMISGTGELTNHPAFKHHISLIPSLMGGSGGEQFAQYCETEKELLNELRLYLKDRRIPVDGFGNIQQYINAHAKLDPSKPKYAKPKGVSAINIRNGRSTTAAKVGELKPGQTLLVLDEFDGWCQVAISDKESGWASLGVVTLTNTPSSVPVTGSTAATLFVLGLSVVTLTNTYVAPSSTTPINSGANAQKTGVASPVGGRQSDRLINASTTRKHMKFLGLELGGKVGEFEKALRGKGFTNGSGFDDSGNFLFLKGVVYGQMSEISIDVTNGRVNGVNVVNMTETEAKAISRYNVFKQHLASEYGEGYVPYENRYEISLPYGNAYTTYGTFDSGDFELGMHISDYEKVLTKIDYNINVFGIGSELVKDYTNWNNVRSTLKTNGYKVVSAATTQIKAVRQVGKFISNVTLNRANTQTTRIKSVVITTTNSLKDVEGYIQYSDYAFAQNSTQGGKLYKNEKCSMEVTEKDGVVTLCYTKATPAAKQTTAQATATSLSLTGPALVGGSLAYLGIPLSEKAEIIKTKLIAMGMKKRRIADDIEEFHGIVDGVKVRVNVGNSASGGSNIRQYDEKSYPLIKAKTRFNTLLNKIVGIYGNGNFDTNESDYKSYTIKNTHGTINVSLFNEDEMEGASPNYVIAVVLDNTK